VIAVRVVGPDDWKLWREMRLAALAESPWAFGSTLADWSGSGDTEERWRSRLAWAALNVVLLRNDESVGMVSAMSHAEDGAIELISLWVAPFARGREVGDAAVGCVVDWAREQRRNTVVLSVKEHNDPARRLYARHGFTDAGPSLDDPGERLMRLGL
jgi:ribosomal protein S18 acetylase RimI-like enzyme